MVTIYCYLEKENDQVLKLCMNNCSSFGINAFLYQTPSCNKRHAMNLQIK